MEEILYRVVQLNGLTSNELFKTRQEAIRAHRGNISKLVEVIPKVTKKTKSDMSSVEALLISKRSNDDLELSLDCGYAVTYNCPKRDRLYNGMRYLEVSDDNVLEAEVVRIEKYEKSVHHHWKGPGYKPNKEWAWAIYHKNGRIVSRKNTEIKYDNSLKGTQGGISYIKIP
jgi:hypothetical protein